MIEPTHIADIVELATNTRSDHRTVTLAKSLEPALPLERGEHLATSVLGVHEDRIPHVSDGAAVGPEGLEPGALEAMRNGGALSMAEEDLDLLQLQPGRVVLEELILCVRLAGNEGRHGCFFCSRAR